MKRKLSLGLIIVLFGMFTFSTAEADPSTYHCRVIPAHTHNGYNYPAKKVCYRGHADCKYVAGHWRHGYWHEGHYVCKKRYYY